MSHGKKKKAASIGLKTAPPLCITPNDSSAGNGNP